MQIHENPRKKHGNLMEISCLEATPRFGFLTAMASNFFFVTRNVLATKFGDVGDMGEAINKDMKT